ncbi:MAG: hypothetical protein EPN70_04905 [Paraburkholderia sp.]|uniref:Lipoprotein n=1 Tax=Paraburkholderia denitrificans TaxID=694025 RepID=A0ABW0J3H1_9BURK|nr:hypothetical protein [Paraburkholderia sp.]TAM06690.1 MAG: hypothetical protein EPN70_04905 [Paraburkholderia sp.]TAM32664.1 MAG: hypothetical protein EPN59_01845 [Paraburkholderia sp.]
MRGLVLLAGVSVLAACTSVTDVHSQQDGHLIVTSRARWNIVSWNRVRNAGIGEAQAYCKKFRKEMHTVEMHTEGLRDVTAQSVVLIFDCI